MVHGRPRSLGQLELVIAIVVIAVLAGFFLHRTGVLRGEIERYSVQADIDAMRTAVTIERIRGDAPEGSNPMDLVGASETRREAYPDGLVSDRYAGERAGEVDDSLPRGQWTYLTDSGWLVYRVQQSGAFDTTLRRNPPHIRVRIPPADDGRSLIVEPVLDL